MALDNKKEFDTLIELKVQQIVGIIITNLNLEFIDALDYFYQSKVYDSLHIESSKIWHLSAEKLFEMLTLEKETDQLTYPDFV